MRLVFVLKVALPLTEYIIPLLVPFHRVMCIAIWSDPDKRAELRRQYEEIAKRKKEYKIIVGATDRADHGRAADALVDYGIVDYNPVILKVWQTDNLHPIMKDFQHDASCGCVGCYSRLQAYWEAFQKAKTANT